MGWRVALAAVIAGLLWTGAPLAADPQPRVRELSVAVYPWTPRPQAFEAALERAWKRKHPDVALRFVAHDVYLKDPPPSLDVFAYDAVLLDHLHAQKLIAPLPERLLGPKDNLVTPARDAGRVGSTLYGLPQIACANFLLHWGSDLPIARAIAFPALQEAIGFDRFAGARPEGRQGLLFDLADDERTAYYYAEAYWQRYGRPPWQGAAPADYMRLDGATLETLYRMMRLASPEHVLLPDDPLYMRTAWLGAGFGRAVLGYFESLSVLPVDVRRRMDFRLMQYADRPAPPLIYVDVVSVHAATLGTPRQPMAEELAALLASPEVVQNAMRLTPDGAEQYLIPVHRSLFAVLADRCPLYAGLLPQIHSERTRVFRGGPEFRAWMAAVKPLIRRRLLGPLADQPVRGTH